MDARVHDEDDLNQLCSQVRVADVLIVTHHHYQHVDDLGYTGVIQHVGAEPGNNNKLLTLKIHEETRVHISFMYFSLVLVYICYKISFEN